MADPINPEAGRDPQEQIRQRLSELDGRLDQLLEGKEKLTVSEQRDLQRELNTIITSAENEGMLSLFSPGKEIIRGIKKDERDKLESEEKTAFQNQLDAKQVGGGERQHSWVGATVEDPDKKRRYKLFIRPDIAHKLELPSGKELSDEEITRGREFIDGILTMRTRIRESKKKPEAAKRDSTKSSEGEDEKRAEAEGQQKEVMSEQFKEMLGGEEDPETRYTREFNNQTIKILEQKTGYSLEFSGEQYNKIKQHIIERYALLMEERASEYLQKNREKARTRGIDPEARGPAAIQAIQQLGVENEVIEKAKSPELRKLRTLLTALEQFSRSELPPSARFTILEQLNQIQELDPSNEELKQLRLEVFRKWSGREPEVGQVALSQQADQFFRTEVLSPKLQELKGALSQEDKVLAGEMGVSEEDFAILKTLGYQVSKEWPGGSLSKAWQWWTQEPKALIIQDRERNRIALWDLKLELSRLHNNWEHDLFEQQRERFLERAKIELGSTFVAGVSQFTETEMKKRYESLKKDVLTDYEKKKFEEQKEGERAIAQAEEALEGRGKTVNHLFRSVIGGEGGFSNPENKEAVLRELKDQLDIDFSLDRLAEFEKATGLEYATFAKKKRRFVLYVLRLISYALQESKRASATL